ncbi:hypothetical protein BH11PLA2_BH11PLA2_11410 [soil metagenome]
MSWYGLAADAMVGIHVGYVAYVLLGQLAIVIAAPFQWQWARNPWFRFTHLLAIAIVAVEAIMHWRCPLSIWEEQLRVSAGQDINSSDTFMGRILHNLLFVDNMPESFWSACYVGMLLIVVQGLVMYPPRGFRRRSLSIDSQQHSES